MPKKLFFFIVLLLIFFGGLFFISKQSKKIKLSIPEIKKEQTAKSTKQTPAADIFFVTGWIPYWAKQDGLKSLDENLNSFSELRPFAFSVDKNGKIIDTLRIKDDPWPKLFKDAKTKNIEIVPTILWGDASAMHNVFSNSILLDQHISNILNVLEENNFAGIDIDYEGKDVNDRDLFSEFLKKLSEKLSAAEKKLTCTVEAKTQDNPPAEFTGTRAMSWANDFSALNKYCDIVTLMAYDQVFQVNRAQSWQTTTGKPLAPNADNSWVEENIIYALKFIEPKKLILGVPTYGWEFEIKKQLSGYKYTKIKSITYEEAFRKAQDANTAPIRNEGELSFVYKTSDKEHLVSFADNESIKQKIKLAKKYKLKGVSIFKIDGLTDPMLFLVLKNIKTEN